MFLPAVSRKSTFASLDVATTCAVCVASAEFSAMHSVPDIKLCDVALNCRASTTAAQTKGIKNCRKIQQRPFLIQYREFCSLRVGPYPIHSIPAGIQVVSNGRKPYSCLRPSACCTIAVAVIQDLKRIRIFPVTQFRCWCGSTPIWAPGRQMMLCILHSSGGIIDKFA